MTKLDIYFWNSIDAKTSFSWLKDTNSVTHSSVCWGTDKGTILSFNEVGVMILSQLDCYCPTGASAMGCLCALKTNKPKRDWAPAQYSTSFSAKRVLVGSLENWNDGADKELTLGFYSHNFDCVALKKISRNLCHYSSSSLYVFRRKLESTRGMDDCEERLALQENNKFQFPWCIRYNFHRSSFRYGPQYAHE